MRLNSVKILKINITCDPRQKILEEIRKSLTKFSIFNFQFSKKDKKPIIIVTPNPEQIVLAQKDLHFADILNRADVAIPDGVGILLAAKFLNVKCQMSNVKWKLQRIPGVEFMEDLVKMAAKEGFPIALIGGRQDLAVEAFECLQEKYPGLQGWGLDPGEMEDGKYYSRYNYYNLYKKIQDTGVRMVFVGLGAPKQELLIEALRNQISDIRGQMRDHKIRSPISEFRYPVVFMSVGGAFEMIAGRIKRAPLFIRLIGFEWLWRLFQQPWRWKRQLTLAEFMTLVLKEKFLQLFRPSS